MYCLSVCVFSHVPRFYESCTRPISTRAGVLVAGQYRLTHGTDLVARRLEGVDVVGLLWLWWCVLNATGFEILAWLCPHQTHMDHDMPCAICL